MAVRQTNLILMALALAPEKRVFVQNTGLIILMFIEL